MTTAENRCAWLGMSSSSIYIAYHDTEWGVPIHDDHDLFESLVLDGFQAGLSWLTILKKRSNFRLAFDNFNAEKIACYGQAKHLLLMKDTGIIRNRAKIEAATVNAKAFLKLCDSYGSFDQYIWHFTNGRTIVNQWDCPNAIPAETKDSQRMSIDLKSRGFQFVGPKICYAFMQAVGIVNDHLVGCFRHSQV